MRSSHEVATEIMDQFKIHEASLHPIDNNELFLEIVEIMETSEEEIRKDEKQLSNDPAKVVFDDPVYCEDNKYKCVHLNSIEWKCDEYTKNSLLKHDMLRWFIKCEQCKKAYKKAKT